MTINRADSEKSMLWILPTLAAVVVLTLTALSVAAQEITDDLLSVPHGEVPKFILGRWRTVIQIDDPDNPEDAVSEELLYEFDELGRFSVRSQTLAKGPRGEMVLNKGLEQLSRGVYSISKVAQDRFVMTAQVDCDVKFARTAVIERLDGDTLRDPGGLILRRVR